MKIFAYAVIGLTIAACGDDGATRRDAGTTLLDATGSIDALPIDATPEPVTVTYTSQGSAVVGATVYFQNADFSLAGEAMTDTNGSASHLLAAGGYVSTVVLHPGSVPDIIAIANYEIQTIAGVQPGDHLQIADSSSTGTPITVHVTVPTVINATSYQLETTCGNGSLNGGSGSATTTQETDVVLEGTCGGIADMVVIASGSGVTTTASYTASVAVSDGATVNLTNPYNALSTETATYTDVPAAFDSLTLTANALTTHGLLDSEGASGDVSGGGATLTFSHATIPLAKQLSATQANGAFGANQVIESSSASATYTLDVGAAILPQIATAPTFSVATQSLTWTESATGTTVPVLARATVEAEREGSGSGSSTNWTWTVVQARNGQAVLFPTLPSDVQDFTFAATDDVFVDELMLATPPGTYDSVRAIVDALPDPSVLVTSSNGRVVIEDFEPADSLVTPPRVHRARSRRRSFARPLVISDRARLGL